MTVCKWGPFALAAVITSSVDTGLVFHCLLHVRTPGTVSRYIRDKVAESWTQWEGIVQHSPKNVFFIIRNPLNLLPGPILLFVSLTEK
ncbi:4598_t:CDS:2, partial [Dentiscutata heterogama]